MQTKFKRHESVFIKRSPNTEMIEYHNLEENDDKQEIKPGMRGKINLILPNGQYHVQILDKKGNTIAYSLFNEEDLELSSS